MTKMIRILGATALATTFAAPVAAQEQTFITIGTGGVTGVYYPTGGAICRLMNRTRADHGIRCSVESTGGSVYNANAVQQGELEFGVAQSDVQYQKYNGTEQFEDQGAYEGLRAVFSIHPEPFTVVARADAGIETFEDLEGKRVNIGNPGSGQRVLMERMMEEMGWSTSDFQLASELQAAEQSQALCDNNIDAMVYSVGHPSGSIQEATTACDSILVPVDNEASQSLIENNEYYREAIIPGGMYRGTDEDTKTFGVGATLVTSADVSEDAVYALVSAVFENFDQFKGLHPAFANLEKEQMVNDGLSAPLHPGAERYYREAGLLDGSSSDSSATDSSSSDSSAADSTSSDNSSSDSSATDGTATDGSATDGSATDASSADGSATDTATDAPATDGAATDDSAMDDTTSETETENSETAQ